MASQHSGTNARLFVSPVKVNFFGYRIIDNAKGEVAHNVTVGFRYRDHEIAFSTFDPMGAKVLVLRNGVLIDEAGSVEAAIASVDERHGWQGANALGSADRARRAGVGARFG